MPNPAEIMAVDFLGHGLRPTTDHQQPVAQMPLLDDNDVSLTHRKIWLLVIDNIGISRNRQYHLTTCIHTKKPTNYQYDQLFANIRTNNQQSYSTD